MTKLRITNTHGMQKHKYIKDDKKADNVTLAYVKRGYRVEMWRVK